MTDESINKLKKTVLTEDQAIAVVETILAYGDGTLDNVSKRAGSEYTYLLGANRWGENIMTMRIEDEAFEDMIYLDKYSLKSFSLYCETIQNGKKLMEKIKNREQVYEILNSDGKELLEHWCKVIGHPESVAKYDTIDGIEIRVSYGKNGDFDFAIRINQKTLLFKLFEKMINGKQYKLEELGL